MNRSNEGARQKEIRLPAQKSRRTTWTNVLRRKNFTPGNSTSFCSKHLSVVSPTNCHAIVNILFNTADLNLINAVATIY